MSLLDKKVYLVDTKLSLLDKYVALFMLDSLLKICIFPAGLLCLFFADGPLGQANQ